MGSKSNGSVKKDRKHVQVSQVTVQQKVGGIQGGSITWHFEMVIDLGSRKNTPDSLFYNGLSAPIFLIDQAKNLYVANAYANESYFKSDRNDDNILVVSFKPDHQKITIPADSILVLERFNMP